MTDPRADRFLQKLKAGEQNPDPVVIVAAHPDDDVIMIGGQLPRLSEATVVHVTDGAPRDNVDARRAGFTKRAEYARARWQESVAALALAGVPASRLVTLGAVDQEAAHDLVALSHRLAGILEDLRATIIVAHAFEGGHPDHDAASFLVHAAASIIARKRSEPSIVEAPCYHAGPQGLVLQRFAAPDGETVIPLTPEQRDLKRRMLDAHRTQAAVLAPFTLETERFRRAPCYDFGVLPNGGRLHYETCNWNMTGAHWLELADRAVRRLQH